MASVLLVVDAQNAFFDGAAGPPVHLAQAVLRNLCDLAARARGRGAPVVFVQHNEPGSDLERATATWQLHPELRVRGDEPVVEKTRPDSFLQTGLAGVLERYGAHHLIVAGNQTEFCIDTTCRSAVSHGFRVTLAADAHGTWDNPYLEAAAIIAHHNHVLGVGFADVVPTAEIVFD